MTLDLFGQGVGARNKRSLDRERTVGEKRLSICLHNWQKIEDGRENKIVECTCREQFFPPIMRRGLKLGNAKWYKNANQRGEKDGCVTRPHRELRTDWLEFCRVSFCVKPEKNCKKRRWDICLDRNNLERHIWEQFRPVVMNWNNLEQEKLY